MQGKNLWKRYSILFVWVIIFIYFIAIQIFPKYHKNNTVCKSVQVNISNNEVFTNTDLIYQLIKKDSLLLGKKYSDINISEIESHLMQYSAIKNAEIFEEVDGVIRIDIQERVPIIRVYNAEGKSYYIDTDGEIMLLSDRYSANVILASGNIKEGFDIKNGKSILTDKQNILAHLYEIANFIAENKFWNSQIEQIYINTQQQMELVPRVGAHRIIFGKPDNFEKKFSKLKTFYSCLNTEGWNTYSYINLAYKGQIVCK